MVAEKVKGLQPITAERRSGEYENLLDAGVPDPAKVTRRRCKTRPRSPVCSCPPGRSSLASLRKAPLSRQVATAAWVMGLLIKATANRGAAGRPSF